MKHLTLSVVCLVATLWAWNPIDAATRTASVDRQEGMFQGPACEDGLILDDGSAETAYGWVPSSVMGEFVQTFPVGPLISSRLDSVCVCWTRTRTDDALDFEIVVYSGAQGSPSRMELFAVPSSLAAVPEWPDAAFVEVEIPLDAPVLGGGFHHIGVRWNPSVDQFFFLCADQSPTDDPEGGFFRDDRSQGQWASILDSTDPIFQDHRAMMVRVRAQQVPWVPTAGSLGLAVLTLLVGAAGWFGLRRRGSV